MRVYWTLCLSGMPISKKQTMSGREEKERKREREGVREGDGRDEGRSE